MFRVSLQFFRQSTALVPGPVCTSYAEKVASKSVPVASTCMSAVPAGHPVPRRLTPWILTLEGLLGLGAAAARPRRGVRSPRRSIFEIQNSKYEMVDGCDEKRVLDLEMF